MGIPCALTPAALQALLVLRRTDPLLDGIVRRQKARHITAATLYDGSHVKIAGHGRAWGGSITPLSQEQFSAHLSP